MSVTFTANYKEVFAAETVEFIDGLLEDNYALDDILEFVDQYSEHDLVSHYVEYVEQGENLGYDVVDAFVGYHGISYVENCGEAYRGTYDSEADFAEEFTNEIYGDVPSYVVVDWQATWDQNLRYDFDFVDGFVFHSNF
jgi:antirestriction protein